jgi:hypothetical protein
MTTDLPTCALRPVLKTLKTRRLEKTTYLAFEAWHGIKKAIGGSCECTLTKKYTGANISRVLPKP